MLPDPDPLRHVPEVMGPPEEDVLRACQGPALYWALWEALRDEGVGVLQRHESALRAARAEWLKQAGFDVAAIGELLRTAGHKASERTVKADLARVRWVIQTGRLVSAASGPLPSVPVEDAERMAVPVGRLSLAPLDRLLVHFAEGDREDEAARRVRQAASYREFGSHRW